MNIETKKWNPKTAAQQHATPLTERETSCESINRLDGSICSITWSLCWCLRRRRGRAVPWDFIGKSIVDLFSSWVALSTSTHLFLKTIAIEFSPWFCINEYFWVFLWYLQFLVSLIEVTSLVMHQFHAASIWTYQWLFVCIKRERRIRKSRMEVEGLKNTTRSTLVL